MTTQQDDFLTQVLATETKANEIIENAKNDIAKKRQKLESSLEEERIEALSKAKAKAKETLQNKQVGVKEIYKELLMEGKKEASVLMKGVEKKEESVLNSAEIVFLSEII